MMFEILFLFSAPPLTAPRRHAKVSSVFPVNTVVHEHLRYARAFMICGSPTLCRACNARPCSRDAGASGKAKEFKAFALPLRRAALTRKLRSSMPSKWNEKGNSLPPRAKRKCIWIAEFWSKLIPRSLLRGLRANTIMFLP